MGVRGGAGRHGAGYFDGRTGPRHRRGAVCLQPHLAEKGRVTNEAEGLAAEEVPAQLGGAGIRRRAGGGAEACAGAGGGKPHAAGIHQRRGARAAGKAAGNSDRKE